MSESIDELTALEKRLVLEHTSALMAMAKKPPGLPFAITGSSNSSLPFWDVAPQKPAKPGRDAGSLSCCWAWTAPAKLPSLANSAAWQLNKIIFGPHAIFTGGRLF